MKHAPALFRSDPRSNLLVRSWCQARRDSTRRERDGWSSRLGRNNVAPHRHDQLGAPLRHTGDVRGGVQERSSAEFPHDLSHPRRPRHRLGLRASGRDLVRGVGPPLRSTASDKSRWCVRDCSAMTVPPHSSFRAGGLPTRIWPNPLSSWSRTNRTFGRAQLEPNTHQQRSRNDPVLWSQSQDYVGANRHAPHRKQHWQRRSTPPNAPVDTVRARLAQLAGARLASCEKP